MSKPMYMLVKIDDLYGDEFGGRCFDPTDTIEVELSKENINNLIGDYMFTNRDKPIAEQHFELTDLIMKELLKIEP